MTLTMSGADLLSTLAGRSLREPISLIGMARAHNTDVIEFNVDLNGESWIEIPLALVENVDVLAVVPWDDNQYALVRMHLNEKARDAGNAAVMTDLLRDVSSALFYRVKQAAGTQGLQGDRVCRALCRALQMNPGNEYLEDMCQRRDCGCCGGAI
jgi:hypothetical protein